MQKIKTFKSIKHAISETDSINIDDIKRIYSPAGGIMNCGIFKYNDIIFKASVYKREAKACRKLIDKNFKNVCKIFNVFEVKVDLKNPYTIFIIKQEKLNRDRSINFYSIRDYLSTDILDKKQVVYDIINGLEELRTVGIEYNDLHSLNVMRDNDGQLKIIDFGCIKLKRKIANLQT